MRLLQVLEYLGARQMALSMPLSVSRHFQLLQLSQVLPQMLPVLSRAAAALDSQKAAEWPAPRVMFTLCPASNLDTRSGSSHEAHPGKVEPGQMPWHVLACTEDTGLSDSVTAKGNATICIFLPCLLERRDAISHQQLLSLQTPVQILQHLLRCSIRC